MAIAFSPLLFLQLGLPCCSSLLSAIFNSSRHFCCRAIFIATVHFIIVLIAAFHSWLDLFFSFVELPFLLWSCCCHNHFAAKDIFIVTTGPAPFFCFSGCHSSCHCHAVMLSVVLSEPASYSPELFSIPVKRCEHAYQYFMVAYCIGKVRQLCSYRVR